MGFSWLKNLFSTPQVGSAGNKEIDVLEAFHADQQRIRKAGEFRGRHYTEYVEMVKTLKREKDHEALIELLHLLVDATEAEARAMGSPHSVAPGYYEQLAIVFRKEKRFDDEVAILSRYGNLQNAAGLGPSKFADRLAKAKVLASQHR